MKTINRLEAIKNITESRIDTITSCLSYATSIIEDGFKGLNNMTDAEIQQEYQDEFNEYVEITDEDVNKLFAIFDVETIKDAVKKCPKGDFVVITSDWAYDRPYYTDEDQAEDRDVNELDELEKAIGYPVFVDDANQLVCDPNGILNDDAE